MTTAGDDIVERLVDQRHARNPDGTLYRDLTDAIAEIRRLRERLGPFGLEVIWIDEHGHYVNARVKAEIEALRAAAAGQREETIDIVFDGPPSHESGRFVEVEDSSGRSIRFGEWIKRDDGYWVLRFTPQPAKPVPVEAVEAAQRMLSKGPGENHSPLDISTVCRALLAMADKE